MYLVRLSQCIAREAPPLFLPPYLEHERVGPRVEPGVAEHRLDGVVRAEDDRGLGPDLQREDVAVLPGESGEGAAEVEHVQEGQVAEEGDADGARGQQGPGGLAVVAPVVAATSGVRNCGSLLWVGSVTTYNTMELDHCPALK